MQTKLRKWGNSLGLRIPKAFAEETGVADGSAVDLTIRGGDLVVRPSKRRKYRLKDLVQGITSKNRHREIDWGGPVGRELWP